MLTKVQKWGNSLGLRIPKSFAEEAQVHSGSTVDLAVVDGQMIIRPVRKPSFKLHDLISRVSKRNLHSEVETGSPMGGEVW